MKKIAFYTLGCKLNFAESSGLSQKFIDLGFEIVDFQDAADVYVINTCTVTALAEKKGKQIIQKALKHEGAKVAVIGCFSELSPEVIKKLRVDYVFGNADKHLLVDAIQNDVYGAESIDIARQKEFYPFYSFGDRTRSFFKIQDGCDNFCTYCAIPYARGRSRSNTVAQTVKLAQEIADKKCKEIILTGVNIGDFGKHNQESFFDLIQALEKVEGIERYRISSIEPDLLSSEIIDFVASSVKFMPHFHIPLQAGSNEVLAQMKRHYPRELFAEKVEEIHRKMPHAFIAADVIVGFPTETSEQFESAYQFIEALPLSSLHVFTYSPRPNTPAATMENVFPMKEKKVRSQRLHELSEELKIKFYKAQQGKEEVVLWESDGANGKMYGYTPNYIKVQADFDVKKINELHPFHLNKVEKLATKDLVFL